MSSLQRPEGPSPDDLTLSRRSLFALPALAGYAAFSSYAHAQPIRTDTEGLIVGDVRIPTRDGAIDGYSARPDVRGRSPVVIVVPEVFGIHEYIRDVCRRLAKQGYVAIAPDFFDRAGDPSGMTDFSQIQRIVATATNEQVMGDLAATLAFARAQSYADVRRAGITGFCWGGAVVWRACARFRDFDAGVAWYGRLAPPEESNYLAREQRPWPLQVVRDLNCPVLGLYAENDRGIPLSTVEQMRGELRRYRKRDSDIVVYPGAQHGFHADYRDSYDAADAADGWRRLLAHFERHVKPRRLFG